MYGGGGAVLCVGWWGRGCRGVGGEDEFRPWGQESGCVDSDGGSVSGDGCIGGEVGCVANSYMV